MKILLVNAINYGGAYSALRKFEAELSANGHECKIITPWSSSKAKFIGVNLIRWTLKFLYKIFLKRDKKTIVSTQSLQTGLGKIIDKTNSDYVILFWLSDCISLDEVRNLKTPFLWRQSDNNLALPFEHYPENRVYCRSSFIENYVINNKKRFIQQNAKRLFGPSQKAVNPLNDICPDSSFVFPTPLKSIFRSYPSTFDRNNKNLVRFGFVLFLQQDLDRKNWSDVEKFAENFNKHKSCNIIHMGGETLSSKHIHVENCGFIENDEDKIVKFYDQIDALVFFSKQDNSPQVVLEAMARGCFIICYDVEGIAELITHNEDGFIVKDISDDSVNLTQRKLLMESYAIRNQRMSKNAQMIDYNINDILRV